jgi:hypothetical protein
MGVVLHCQVSDTPNTYKSPNIPCTALLRGVGFPNVQTWTAHINTGNKDVHVSLLKQALAAACHCERSHAQHRHVALHTSETAQPSTQQREPFSLLKII